MSLSTSSSRMLFRRSANARFAVPRGMRVRFDSTAAAAKESVKSTAEGTTKKAAETAKMAQKTANNTAESTAAKAAELQNQVTAGLAKAQEYSKQAAAGLAKAGANAQAMTQQLSQSGGTTGKIASAVNKQLPFAVYYARVAIETFKLIFQSQKMAPPPLSTFQSFFDATLAKLKNPSELVKIMQQAYQSVRGVNTVQLVAGGVVAAECLGFFTIGEMIGRFKLIGYRGKTEAAHH